MRLVENIIIFFIPVYKISHQVLYFSESTSARFFMCVPSGLIWSKKSLYRRENCSEQITNSAKLNPVNAITFPASRLTGSFPSLVLSENNCRVCKPDTVSISMASVIFNQTRKAESMQASQISQGGVNLQADAACDGLLYVTKLYGLRSTCHYFLDPQ